ncbi:cell division protein FtsL [Robiginitomaculum antarcticum]
MRRIGFALLILIGFGLVAALYITKTEAKSVGKDMERLQSDLQAEIYAIRVLEAEIAYLQNPARLSDLSRTYLELRPTKADQMITLDDLVVRVPVKAQVTK